MAVCLEYRLFATSHAQANSTARAAGNDAPASRRPAGQDRRPSGTAPPHSALSAKMAGVDLSIDRNTQPIAVSSRCSRTSSIERSKSLLVAASPPRSVHCGAGLSSTMYLPKRERNGARARTLQTSTEGTMQCLFIADLHYSLPQFDWLLQSAPRYDLVVLAGDALDVASNVDFRAQTLVVLKYLHRIASVTQPIVCSGNHDQLAQ